MNAFEEIIAGLFWEEGYWTHVGYKVNLPKEKKAELGGNSGRIYVPKHWIGKKVRAVLIG